MKSFEALAHAKALLVTIESIESIRYGDKRWGEIKECLKVVGVDADTATVGKEQRSLRSELERLARQCCVNEQAWKMMSCLPAREFDDQVTGQRNKVAVVRDMFAYGASWGTWAVGEKCAAEIHQMLTTVEAEVQKKMERRIQEAAKKPHDDSELDFTGLRYEGRRGNARKYPARNTYMRQLAVLWDELAGASNTPRHRNRFVAACAFLVEPITIKEVRDYLSKKTKTTT